MQELMSNLLFCSFLMSYLLRSVILPQCNVQYTGSLVPSLQTFTKLAKKAVIWHTKTALGALPLLPFLSQIALTGSQTP